MNCLRDPSLEPPLTNAPTDSEKHKLPHPLLLGSALNPLASLWLVIIIVHAGGTSSTSLLVGIHVLEISSFRHGILWWDDSRWAGRQDLLQGLEGFWVRGPVVLGELDVELDVQVAEVVVAVGWHTLPPNHLYRTYLVVSEDLDKIARVGTYLG